jgi:cobalt-zinc-cadmium efflux system outer membrane protein
MARHAWRALTILLPLAAGVCAQTTLNWEQVRERFRSNNPALAAGATNIEETRANETTAGLRPNPNLSVVSDQWHVFESNPYRPFGTAQTTAEVSQLVERRNKRGIRVQSAQLATSMAGTDQADLERQLTFNLRDAFVRTLQSKSVLELAEENMRYYDRTIELNRRRFESGDLSRADFERIELQRAQYEADVETARVNLRTAKIDLLALMNDRTPADAFDITGDFDFKETILLPAELHQAAVESRGDIRSAQTAIEKAKVDNRLAWANGSWDPIVGMEYGLIGADHTIGFDFSIPLRIFDKNQGEKLRSSLEIKRSEQSRQNVVANAFRDIDAAYASVENVRKLLRPYRDKYLPEAERVREAVSFAYSRGAASLLDFLDAQKAYRDAQLSYRNLIASYLSAANQLNLAVGREVLQ